VTSTAVTHSVIAGLDPAIHGLRWATIGLDRAVDARVTPGHDNCEFRILICCNRIRPTGQRWVKPGHPLARQAPAPEWIAPSSPAMARKRAKELCTSAAAVPPNHCSDGLLAPMSRSSAPGRVPDRVREGRSLRELLVSSARRPRAPGPRRSAASRSPRPGSWPRPRAGSPPAPCAPACRPWSASASR
jgi:hypothetical protein